MTQNAPLLSPEVCDTLFDAAQERHLSMEVHSAPGLSHQLQLAARFVAQQAAELPKPYDGCLMFFTVTAQHLPITSFCTHQPSIDEAWAEGAARIRQWAWAFNATSMELRVDWVTAVLPLAGDDPQEALADLRQSWSLADHAPYRSEMLAALSQQTTRALSRLQQLSDAVPPNTQARWHLVLEGLHLCPLGEMRTLPHYPPAAPRQNRGDAAPAIYQATQQLLALSQSEDGSWPEASTLIDHLGITYALLLTQRQSGTTAASSMTVHRAIAYQVAQMQRWSLHECGSDLLKAMGLIVLVQYVHLYPGAGSAAALRDLIGLLSQQLHGKTGNAAGASAPWAQLALQSLQLSGQQAGDAPGGSEAASATDCQWLHAAWQQMHALAQDQEHSKLHPEPWVATALMECSLQHGQPAFSSPAQRSQFFSGMQSLFKTCYQRRVWPKAGHPLAGRQRPASGGSRAPLTDCRVASQLLITISAAVNFSNLARN